MVRHGRPRDGVSRRNYSRLHGVRQFHACYPIGGDELWDVVRKRESAANTLEALKSIRARRPDDEQIYVILDNLSAHKGQTIRKCAWRNKVELCFTPTYSSWANPIEAHCGPLREFVLNNSNHPNHTVLTRRLHTYLRWRNANARVPCTTRRPTPRRSPDPSRERTAMVRPAAKAS